MGQKMPPPPRLAKVDPRKEADGGFSTPARAEPRRLVERMAEALGIPSAALYGARPWQDAPPAANEGGIAADGGLDGACARLLHAYRRITASAERRRVLARVQAAAERN